MYKLQSPVVSCLIYYLDMWWLDRRVSTIRLWQCYVTYHNICATFSDKSPPKKLFAQNFCTKLQNARLLSSSVHTYRVKGLHSVMVHLRVWSVWITLLQGVILEVQHCAYIQSLVKLWTKFVPKHKRHCSTLVSNFKVCLKYDKAYSEKRGEKWSRNKQVSSCSHLVTEVPNSWDVQTHLVGVINLEPKLPIIP